MTSLLILIPGCSQHGVGEVEPTPREEYVQEISLELSRDLDLLFVLENSSDMMSAKQQALAESFGSFIEDINAMAETHINLHVGVISADLGGGPYTIANCQANGDRGILQNQALLDDCTGPTDRYISDTESDSEERNTNYSGSIEETFSCISQLGANGCRFGQPLEAMYRSLNNSNGGLNSGFLRTEANLAVLFVTSGDDCSAEDLSVFDNASQLDKADSSLGYFSDFRCFEFGVHCDPDSPRETGVKQSCTPRASSEYMHDIGKYVAFLRSLKRNPSKLFVAAIRGSADELEVVLDEDSKPHVAATRCEVDSTSSTRPAIRIDSFVQEFPKRSMHSICSGDMKEVLTSIAQGIGSELGSPCIGGDLLVDEDGQPNCTLVRRTPEGEESLLPKCDASLSTLPCYHFDLNSNRCSATPSGLVLSIERGELAPYPDTTVVAHCKVN